MNKTAIKFQGGENMNMYRGRVTGQIGKWNTNSSLNHQEEESENQNANPIAWNDHLIHSAAE